MLICFFAFQFQIQAEVHWTMIFANGESGNSLFVPVITQYYLQEKVSIQVVPQLIFFQMSHQELRNLGLDLPLVMSMILFNSFSTANYSIGLNNRLEDFDFLDEFCDNPLSIFKYDLKSLSACSHFILVKMY